MRFLTVKIDFGTIGLTLLVVMLSACATPKDQLLGRPIAGTSWQLIAIQSMDDTQGTVKIIEPKQFTLTFSTDGRAAFRLNCNRGGGEYKVTPAGDGASGSLSFGPIAATRALCPPPNQDERVVRDLAYVRSFLLKDGKLYLSLMADGGIYEWAPLQE